MLPLVHEEIPIIQAGANRLSVHQTTGFPTLNPAVEQETEMSVVGFGIRPPNVPRAFIVWLAHAVKVVRPCCPCDSTLTALATPGVLRLGITLGICMSGFGNGAWI
jgi:hypothetical protein